MDGLAISAVCLVMLASVGGYAPGAAAAQGPHDENVAPAAAPAAQEASGGGWRERRHWDWGQHRLFAAELRPPLAPPRLKPDGEGWHDDHWDDPGAPVRIAVPTPPPSSHSWSASRSWSANH